MAILRSANRSWVLPTLGGAALILLALGILASLDIGSGGTSKPRVAAAFPTTTAPAPTATEPPTSAAPTTVAPVPPPPAAAAPTTTVKAKPTPTTVPPTTMKITGDHFTVEVPTPSKQKDTPVKTKDGATTLHAYVTGSGDSVVRFAYADLPTLKTNGDVMTFFKNASANAAKQAKGKIVTSTMLSDDGHPILDLVIDGADRIDERFVVVGQRVYSFGGAAPLAAKDPAARYKAELASFHLV